MILLLLCLVELCWVEAAPSTGSLLAELESYDRQILALDKEITALGERFNTLRAQQEQNATTAREATARLTGQRAQTRKRLTALYRLRRNGLVAMVLGASDPSTLRRRVYYLQRVIERDRQQVQAHMAAVETAKQAEQQAAADLALLAETQNELSQQRAVFEQERTRRMAFLRSIRESPALVEETRQVRSELSVPTSSPSPTSGFAARKGALPAPVNGLVVEGFEGTGTGLVFSASIGTTFRAVYGGTVQTAGYIRGLGQVIILDHGGYSTLYAHANGLKVVQGDTVDAGTALGYVGTTGLDAGSDGSLLFEVRRGERLEDPMEWLNPQSLRCAPSVSSCR